MHRTIALAGLLAIGACTMAIAQNANVAPFSKEQMQRMQAQFAKANAIPDTRGTGPYPAIKEMAAGLPDHVIYRPADLSVFKPDQLGVVGWGNGGCSDDGASQRQHNLELASHGYIVIAPGRILSGPGAPPRKPAPAGPMKLAAATTSQQVMAGIAWALSESARKASPYYRLIDSNKVAVAGFSCGGLQALQLAGDPRIKAVIIHSSGIFPDNAPDPIAGISVSKSLLAKLHTPILYILGGPKDIAFNNGMDDFKRIENVPAMVVYDDSGHGGSFMEPNGGEAAQIALKWLAWQLNGDKGAEKDFVGKDCTLCTEKRWTIARKNFPAAIK